MTWLGALRFNSYDYCGLDRCNAEPASDVGGLAPWPTVYSRGALLGKPAEAPGKGANAGDGGSAEERQTRDPARAAAVTVGEQLVEAVEV